MVVGRPWDVVFTGFFSSAIRSLEAFSADWASNPHTKQVLDMMNQTEGGYSVPRNLDPLFDKDVSMTEMTQLSERPGFTDIAGTMPPDAIGGLRELVAVRCDSLVLEPKCPTSAYNLAFFHTPYRWLSLQISGRKRH